MKSERLMHGGNGGQSRLRVRASRISPIRERRRSVMTGESPTVSIWLNYRKEASGKTLMHRSYSIAPKANDQLIYITDTQRNGAACLKIQIMTDKSVYRRSKSAGTVHVCEPVKILRKVTSVVAIGKL